MYIDGDWYFYTGMTSADSMNRRLDLCYQNTRTKETTFYKIAGATEKLNEISRRESSAFRISIKFPITIKC